MSKHTPGRWYKEPAEDGGRVLVDDARSTIIHVPPGSPFNPACAADAQLISAAPDMLAALEAAKRYVAMCNANKITTTAEGRKKAGEVFEAVVSAIAKATGN